MYCVKCGVELSDGKKPCPLCGTVPYHPDVEGAASEPTYPPYVKPEKKIKKSLNPAIDIEGVLLTMLDSRTNLGFEVVEDKVNNIDSFFVKKGYNTSQYMDSQKDASRVEVFGHNFS